MNDCTFPEFSDFGRKNTEISNRALKSIRGVIYCSFLENFGTDH